MIVARDDVGVVMRIGSQALQPFDVDRPDAVRGLVGALRRGGFALLDGVPGADALLTVARTIGRVVPHRDSRTDGVTVLADRGMGWDRGGFAGFGREELVPHTDRSGFARPPGLLMMACAQPAQQGGECVVADGAAVYADLAENEPEALDALSAPRSALFGGAAGYLGSVFTPEPDGRITVRLRLDELVRFSPEAARWRATLRLTIERHLITVALRAGQGYVLDNRRWLHGRRAFAGDRVHNRVTALLFASVVTASFAPSTNTKLTNWTHKSTTEKRNNSKLDLGHNDYEVGLPQSPALPNAINPTLYRALLDQMDAGPGQQLLDTQNFNQHHALTPPAPPTLPQQFTHSDSQCRAFGDTLNHSGAQLIPGGGLVTNLLQHLCLLGSP